MTQKCTYHGCQQDALIGVHGIHCCFEHEAYFLKQKLRELWPKLTIEKGVVKTPHFMNVLARLLERTPEAQLEGLTKGKLEMRTYNFLKRGDLLYFSIERHPVKGDFEQRWLYDLEGDGLKLLREKLLRSRYKFRRGKPLCPRCSRVLIDITPGRIRCSCGYEDLHEHSLDW